MSQWIKVRFERVKDKLIFRSAGIRRTSSGRTGPRSHRPECSLPARVAAFARKSEVVRIIRAPVVPGTQGLLGKEPTASDATASATLAASFHDIAGNFRTGANMIDITPISALPYVYRAPRTKPILCDADGFSPLIFPPRGVEVLRVELFLLGQECFDSGSRLDGILESRPPPTRFGRRSTERPQRRPALICATTSSRRATIFSCLSFLNRGSSSSSATTARTSSSTEVSA